MAHVLDTAKRHEGAASKLMRQLTRLFSQFIAEGQTSSAEAKATAKDVADLLEVLVDILGDGVSVELYNVTMHGLAVVGDHEECERVLKEMRGRGVEPTVVTYSTLLHAYCVAGEVEACVRVCQRMGAAGVEPDKHTYNTLAHAFGRIGRIG